MSEKSARIKRLVLLAMFTAIAAVLITLVHFPLFPSAAFLQYDPADVPILIAAFAFGPVAGLIVTVLASFIQAFFLGGDGIYGFLMHVSLPASWSWLPAPSTGSSTPAPARWWAWCWAPSLWAWA